MKLFSLAVNHLNRTRRRVVAGAAAAVLAVGLAGAAQAWPPPAAVYTFQWDYYMAGKQDENNVKNRYSFGNGPCSPPYTPVISNYSKQGIKFTGEVEQSLATNPQTGAALPAAKGTFRFYKWTDTNRKNPLGEQKDTLTWGATTATEVKVKVEPNMKYIMCYTNTTKSSSAETGNLTAEVVTLN